MKNVQKYLILISRIFVGIVFIYSGFVKGVDPLGSTYKFNDYFSAFHVDWASSLSLFLSIFQSVIEFVIGAALLLNLKIRQNIWGALLLMLIFTPLTLYLAIKNPVHDCGCFGDALIITNWETFWKNVIILALVVYLFVARKKIESILKCWEQWMAIGLLALFMGAIIGYSYLHLPIIDFRPYKIGTNILDKMLVPDDAAQDEWESFFVYSKNGVNKEFDIKNLPDSSWQFVEAKHVLLKKGYEPPIHDFSILSSEGDEMTDLILASDNYSFLLITNKLDKYSYKNQERIEKLVEYCNSNGYNFYGLTASSDDAIQEYFKSTSTYFEFYNADDITLKTIIRSNPGLVLLKSGSIIDKWHYNDIPKIDELDKDLSAMSISKYKKSGDNYYILLLIMTSGLMISLYLLLRKLICKK